MHKWLICPGTDGKEHITASRLIELYDVDPRECMVASSDWGPSHQGTRDLTPLYPLLAGGYDEWQARHQSELLKACASMGLPERLISKQPTT